MNMQAYDRASARRLPTCVLVFVALHDECAYTAPAVAAKRASQFHGGSCDGAVSWAFQELPQSVSLPPTLPGEVRLGQCSPCVSSLGRRRQGRRTKQKNY